MVIVFSVYSIATVSGVVAGLCGWDGRTHMEVYAVAPIVWCAIERLAKKDLSVRRLGIFSATLALQMYFSANISSRIDRLDLFMSLLVLILLPTMTIEIARQLPNRSG